MNPSYTEKDLYPSVREQWCVLCGDGGGEGGSGAVDLMEAKG